MAPLDSGECTEFISIPAGLHTKVADSFKRYIFCQHADIKHAAFFNHLPGQISHLYRDCQLSWVISYLKTGVGNTAVVFFRIPGA